jgi:hypothetical protein
MTNTSGNQCPTAGRFAPTAGIDFAFPAREPAPFTTIPFADRPMIDLVLHINREVIHHGAELACIRDLYIHQKET